MTTERALVLLVFVGIVLYALWAMMRWSIGTLTRAMREMDAERRRGAVKPVIGEDD